MNYIKLYLAERPVSWQLSYCFYSLSFQSANARTQAVFLSVFAGSVVDSKYIMFYRIYLTFQWFVVSAELHFTYLDDCHSNMFSHTLS